MMGKNTENNKSLLKSKSVPIVGDIKIKIPTVGQILENEKLYYSIIYSLTAVPYQYMVQLYDMGIDYTKLTDYDLFTILFPVFKDDDLSLIFGKKLFTPDYELFYDKSTDVKFLYSKTNGMENKIDEFVFMKIVDALRKIHNLERVKFKPGNEEAKEYLIKKERKKNERNAKKPYEPYLEKLVIALVNKQEFKYNYDEVMNMSIYKFNQSFKQIQTSVTFDKTMIGVYSGTIDTSKLTDKSCLSWIPMK